MRKKVRGGSKEGEKVMGMKEEEGLNQGGKARNKPRKQRSKKQSGWGHPQSQHCTG